MSIDMYLSEVRSQTNSAVQLANAYSQAIGALSDSCHAFMDAPLSGKTYESAQTYFTTVYPPLVNGVTMVCEALIEAHQRFPDDFESMVDSCDVKESELKEKIAQGKQVLEAQYLAIDSLEKSDPAMERSIMRTQAVIAKLEEKLENLYKFNAVSAGIFSNVESLLNQLNQGISEVGKGSAWNASTGTFELNRMSLSWIQPLNEKWKEHQNALEKKRTEHKEYEFRSRVGEGGEVFYELYVNGVLDAEATKLYNEFCAEVSKETLDKFFNELDRVTDNFIDLIGKTAIVGGVLVTIAGLVGVTAGGGIIVAVAGGGYVLLTVSGTIIIEGVLLTATGITVMMANGSSGNAGTGASNNSNSVASTGASNPPPYMRNKLLGQAKNPRLRNAINQLYKKYSKYGDGGTAAAVIKEALDGGKVGGKVHLEKAIGYATNLERIIRNGNLTSGDMAIAQKLLKDLKDAISIAGKVK